MPDNKIHEVLDDEFDPQVLADKEARIEELEESDGAYVRELLNKRMRAYKNVFSAGKTTQGDLDIVMLDLAFFCRNFSPTLNVNDGALAQLLMNVKEGRREVFGRISDFSKLDENALFIKYHNSNE